MSVKPGFVALEQRRARIAQTDENSARYASAFLSYTTTGWGETLLPEVQRFTTTFLERPSVSHGLSVDGDTLVAGRFPRVTAGVHKWLQDENGFYVGAWLFFIVETVGLQDKPVYVMPTPVDGMVPTVRMTAPIPKDPNYTLVHDFTFTGVAMKSLPSHSLTALL